MKILKKTIFLFALIANFTSCKEDPAPVPVARFSYTISQDVTVTFVNTSTNAQTYLWTFGDGGSSVEKSPTHTYAPVNGTYTVTLKATGAGGNDIITQTVTITLPLPKTEFTYTVSQDVVVAFLNSSTNSDTYSWTFGDGTTSTEKNPVHTYPPASATYTVALKATGGGGSDTFVQTVTLTLPTFSINGSLTNVTGQIVKNASISLFKSGQSIAISTTTVNASGNYSFLNIEKGEYDLKATSTGYLTSSKSVSLTANKTQDIVITGEANVSGLLIDSQTGRGLSQARVSFFPYAGTLPTSVDGGDLIVTTNSNGQYTITGAPVGNYVGIVESAGYYNRTINQINFVAGAVSVPQQTLVSRVPEGQLRVILTWGASPADLDTHLTGPTGVGSNRFHLYFLNKNPSSPGTMSLDVDDTSSFGPETTTMKSFFVGTYRFSVHNYSNQTTAGGAGINSSPARVELYDFNGFVRSFSPSVFTSGNTWKVFELVFTTTGYTINEVNQYYQASSSSDGNSFRTSDTKLTTKFNIDDF